MQGRIVGLSLPKAIPNELCIYIDVNSRDQIVTRSHPIPSPHHSWCFGGILNPAFVVLNRKRNGHEVYIYICTHISINQSSRNLQKSEQDIPSIHPSTTVKQTENKKHSHSITSNRLLFFSFLPLNEPSNNSLSSYPLFSRLLPPPINDDDNEGGNNNDDDDGGGDKIKFELELGFAVDPFMGDSFMINPSPFTIFCNIIVYCSPIPESGFLIRFCSGFRW